ncbi:MAG: FAD-dependent oxidoreductase [Chloroflexota bacterium]
MDNKAGNRPVPGIENCLFKPIVLGRLKLNNRIVFPAITTLYDEFYDLHGDERSEYFYAEVARGGAGLMIIGALQALYPGRRENRVAINHDKYLLELKRWVRAIRDNGARVAAQLAVWNYWAPHGYDSTPEFVSPSGVVTAPDGYPQNFDQEHFVTTSRPLTIDEIKRIEDEVAAAVRAREAGFEAIELPAVSGNLISRFVSPFTNKRTDEYGGLLENRLRMLLETIAAIQRQAGYDLPIICRIPGEDMMPGGLTLDDSKAIAPYIEKAGVQAISIMPGWYETRLPRHQMAKPRGAFAYLAEGIKQVVGIPVCTNMRINDPVLAESIISRGKADLAAMGRALLADPEMPNKVREGRLDEVRYCVACCTCYEDIANHRPCGCSVNPRLGREALTRIKPASKKRRVYVAGGGPGGMEAARVAALRGHKVTLFEKRAFLGGQLLTAILPPDKREWQTTIDYYRHQMRQLKITIKTGQVLTPEIIKRYKPDAVIIATGASPTIPEIPGITGQNTATAIEILTDRKTSGLKVVIIGSGLVGCETALFLSKRGKHVTILEILEEIGLDIGCHNRWLVLDTMKAAGVNTVSRAKVVEVTGSGAWAEIDGKRVFFDCDTVVIAAGMLPSDDISGKLDEPKSEVYRVGDCVSARRVRDAISEGFMTGLKV